MVTRTRLKIMNAQTRSRRLNVATGLLDEALSRLDFLNAGTYEDIGPDEIAEAIRRFLKRVGARPANDKHGTW